MSALLEVNNLKKYFPLTKGIIWQKKLGDIKAVDGISFVIRKGETLGLVGESGCGKTTTGRCLVRLEEPTSGKILFEGKDICSCSGAERKSMRHKMQFVFQDPYGSLDPRQKAGDIVGEPLIVSGEADRKEALERAKETMELVGLEAEMINRYPHMFSGGQRQRLCVARAIILHPSLIICDEPVSALDISIQAQIINLLVKLQEKFELSYLLIAHDLSVVQHVSTWVAVMYLGKIMEITQATELFRNRLHFYSQALISAVPIPDPIAERKRHRIILQGEVPSPINPPSGCRFHPRCWEAKKICTEEEPSLEEVAPEHWVACHRVSEG